MSALASILPLTTLFPTQPDVLRAAASDHQLEKLLPTTTTTTATTAPAATTSTTATTDASTNQDTNTGILGLVHTSLSGLTNFVKNLPQRKSLLGE